MTIKVQKYPTFKECQILMFKIYVGAGLVKRTGFNISYNRF